MKVSNNKDILLQSYKELIVFGAGNAGEMILNFCKNNLKFGVIASDYGDLSIKQAEIFELLSELQICGVSLVNDDWLDCAKLDFRNKSVPELITAYKECWNNCIVTVEGKIFRCSQSVAVYLLKSVPVDSMEYIDFLDKNKTKEILQQEIKNYLYGTEYLKVCNWCTGKTKSEKTFIEKAIQTKETFKYKKYIT